LLVTVAEQDQCIVLDLSACTRIRRTRLSIGHAELLTCHKVEIMK